jgi:hypothetical protein
MLGSGQFGKVFLATEVATSKQLVCKITDLTHTVERQPQISEISPYNPSSIVSSGAEKAKREMWILSKLNHVSLSSLSPTG